MPSVPNNTKCNELGCNNKRSRLNNYCIEHGGRDMRPFNSKYNKTNERLKFNQKYNTPQWVRLRQIQLSKYPLCSGCYALGIIKAANTVDHIFPWSQISDEAFYINRFQSLCPMHHSEKTQLEQRGIFRMFGTPHIDYTRGDYARVMGVSDPRDLNCD